MKEEEEERRRTSSADEKLVMVETSLGTHIAMPLFPNMTAADLKRELGNEHSICFPSIGMITINGLMVKCRSCYYHLPDSIPVKDVFLGWKGTWFLHVDATPSNHCVDSHQSESLVTKFRENVNSCSDVADYRKPENDVTCEFKLNTEAKARERERKECMWSEGVREKTQTHVNIPEKNKRRKKKMCPPKKVVDGVKEMFVHVHDEAQDISHQEQSFHYDIWKGINQGRLTSPPTIQTPNVSVSEVASVTGLITRYFPEFDEVKSSNDPSSYAVSDESGVCESNQAFLQNPLKDKINEEKSNVLHGTFSAGTPPRTINSFPSRAEQNCRTSVGKIERTEVGKRFLLATNNVKDSASKKNSPISICRSKGRKLSSSVDKTAIFEVSDSFNGVNLLAGGQVNCSMKHSGV